MPGEIPHAPSPSVQRPKPLTAEQRKLITAIVPVLEQHGKTITTLMYNQMLEENPALKNVFSKSKQDVRNPTLSPLHDILTHLSNSEASSPRCSHAPSTPTRRTSRT